MRVRLNIIIIIIIMSLKVVLRQIKQNHSYF